MKTHQPTKNNSPVSDWVALSHPAFTIVMTVMSKEIEARLNTPEQKNDPGHLLSMPFWHEHTTRTDT